MCRQGMLMVGCKSNAFSVLYARLFSGAAEGGIVDSEVSSSLKEHTDRRDTLKNTIVSDINGSVPGKHS